MKDVKIVVLEAANEPEFMHYTNDNTTKRAQGDVSDEFPRLADEEQEVILLIKLPHPRDERVTRSSTGIVRVKKENLEGDARCPDPQCNQIISANNRKAINLAMGSATSL